MDVSHSEFEVYEAHPSSSVREEGYWNKYNGQEITNNVLHQMCAGNESKLSYVLLTLTHKLDPWLQQTNAGF